MSEDNLVFWNRQWQKHGSCSTLEQYQYFELAIQEKQTLHLIKRLGSYGIVPSQVNLYDTMFFYNSTSNIFNTTKPQLYCSGSKIPELKEIRVSMDADGEDYIVCPF